MNLKLNSYTLIILFYITIFQLVLNSLHAEAKMSDQVKAIVKKMDNAQLTEKLVNTNNIIFKFKMEDAGKENTATEERTSTQKKTYSKIIANKKIIEKAFDGNTAWSRINLEAIKVISGTEKNALVNNTLEGIGSVKNCYSEINQEKDERYMEKDCLVLNCKKPDSPTIHKLFVDKSNFMILGVSTTMQLFEKTILFETHYINFIKLSNGFLFPEKIDMYVDKEKKITVILIESIVNGNIDEKIFNKPEK